MYNTVKNCVTRIVRFASEGEPSDRRKQEKDPRKEVPHENMIDFAKIKMNGNSPIYMQLIAFIKQGLSTGEIKYGDEMPSRRVLSALLGINPNTVQKAYALMEGEKLISSHAGAKSFISATDEKTAAIRAELAEEGGRRAIGALKAAGYSKEEAIAVLEKYWDWEEFEGDEEK